MSRYLQTRVFAPLLALLVCLALLAPMTAAAQPDDQHMPVTVASPGIALWQEVRQRDTLATGTTQVRGVESGVLIAPSGEAFRDYRVETFIGTAGLFIGAIALLILVFYLFRGRIGIPGGRSGERILRFVAIDRIVHWLLAIVFIILAITGLTLLFGRFVLLPLIGADAFGAVANLFKPVHDYLSPVFLVSLIALTVRFASKNLPARGDLKWLTSGGGIVGKTHASAGYFNAGEKIWFWSVVLFGIGVSISGLVLLFPLFGLSREIMQIVLNIHGIAAVLFIGGALAHIYIGTIGTEGSLESMTTGYVDTNWAEAHHDRWYEKVKDRAEPAPQNTPSGESPSMQTTTQKA